MSLLLPEKEEIHARVIFAQVQKVYRITSAALLFHILTAQGQNVSEKMFTNGYDSCPRYIRFHTKRSSFFFISQAKIQAK